MRGSVLATGEDYVGYYYGIEKSGIVNGKKEYEYDKHPKKFNYKTTTISGSAVFTASKGYEKQQQIINGTLITESQIYRIQTSDSYIQFKNGGKVKILIDGEWKTFTIRKVTDLTSGQYSFVANRLGYFDTTKVPVVLELR